MILAKTKRIISFLRWELKAVRNVNKFIKKIRLKPLRHPKKEQGKSSEIYHDFVSNYSLKLKHKIDHVNISLDPLVGRAEGRAFVDIGREYSIERADIFTTLMAMPDVEKLIMQYFDDEPWLWNVAINYSDVAKGENTSQLWHFDYGDTKQMHFMVYLSEVRDESGPFTYLPINFSKKIKRRFWSIERYTDEHVSQELTQNVDQCKKTLTGLKGDVWVVDPGILMHQGARCEVPRLVCFVSFTTQTPMSNGGKLTLSNEDRTSIWQSYQKEVSGVLQKRAFIS